METSHKYPCLGQNDHLHLGNTYSNVQGMLERMDKVLNLHPDDELLDPIPNGDANVMQVWSQGITICWQCDYHC